MSNKTIQSAKTVTASYRASPGNPWRERTATWYPHRGTMQSFNHPNHPHAGGPWQRSSVTDDRVTGTISNNTQVGEIVTTGFNVTPTWEPHTPEATHPSDAEILGFGTSAIASVEPTQSEYSVATFLGELRAGLPKIVGTTLYRDHTKVARSLGSEYLNYEFGWRPLAADIKAFLKGVTDADEIMNQYRRDSGRRIRRRSSGPVSTKHANVQNVQMAIQPIAQLARGHGYLKETQRMWFSGAFKYYVPDTPATKEVTRFAEMARKVHGLELTPEVVWNLSPWSWAADWFGNTGDIIHNVSALGRDALVMEYGYAMAETIREEQSHVIYKNVPLSRTVRKITQSRHVATPYGFHASWPDFSQKQLAIMSALGISSQKRF